MRIGIESRRDCPYAETGETEVLIHLASGLSCEEIGEVLSVGRRTVENHKYSIQQKIETKSMAELTKLAIREGLVSL